MVMPLACWPIANCPHMIEAGLLRDRRPLEVDLVSAASIQASHH